MEITEKVDGQCKGGHGDKRNFISNDLIIIQNRIEWRRLVAASSLFKKVTEERRSR